jgi:hypothetical protein
MTEQQIESLIEEGAMLKEDVQAKTQRLREIGAILAEQARFPEGKNTAHLVGCRFKATIQRNENLSFDQDALGQARFGLGDAQFFELFGWEFKPRAKKDLDAFLKHSPKADLVRSAMIIKPASPSVTFAALEG